MKTIILNINGQLKSINIESIGLNVLGYMFLIASVWDGFQPAAIGLMIFILDHIRHPYPNILDVSEEEVNEMTKEGDDDDIYPT